MATVMYEGLPIRPDGGIWWSIVEKYRVSVMFSSPTAIRVLKKQDPALLKKYDLSSLRLLFLAGEPLDETTARWIADGVGKPVVDNYWQTETGWPILGISRNVNRCRPSSGRRAFLRPDTQSRSTTNHRQRDQKPNQKASSRSKVVTTGCMTTVWRDDQRFVRNLLDQRANQNVYSTFDWGIRDEDATSSFWAAPTT